MIEWLSDYSDCETCGGNYADGARVTIDGVEALELIPHAHCYGGDHWSELDVYKLIFARLGHTLEDENA
jgi:hypothetical protein